MRITVTGATGNVGTSVVRALADDSSVEEVVGIARRLPRWRVHKTRWRRADVASDDLVRFLRIGLAADPAHRWPSAEALRDAWERALDGRLRTG